MVDSERAKKIRSSIRAKSLQKNIHQTFSSSKVEDYSPNHLLDIEIDDAPSKNSSSKLIVTVTRGRSHSIGDISKMISGLDINSGNNSIRNTEYSSSTLSGPTVSNIKSRCDSEFRKLYEEHKSDLASERVDWEFSSNARKYCNKGVGVNDTKQDSDDDILPPSPTCLDIRAHSLPSSHRQRNSLLKRCHTFSTPGSY